MCRIARSEFSRLPTEAQVALLREQGLLLAERQVPGLCVKLFSLGTLYAEQWLYPRTGQTVLVMALTALSELDPYLSGLPLPF